jgi:hypothetical protein
MTPRPRLAFAALLVIAVGSVANSEDRPASRGERLALEGRCAAAIPELEAEAGAGVASAAWRLGQCHLRQKLYPEAVIDLERALALDPGALPRG